MEYEKVHNKRGGVQYRWDGKIEKGTKILLTDGKTAEVLGPGIAGMLEITNEEGGSYFERPENIAEILN